MRLLRAALLLFALCFPLVASSTDRFTLQLRWYHQFQFAGYYAALKQGYYREAGLDIRILEGSPALDVIETVANKKDEFGVGDSNLLIARAKKKPVVALAVIFQHAPDVLLSLESSHIRKPSDLIGKAVMAGTENDNRSAQYRGMLLSEGISPEKVKWVPHTWKFDDLLKKRVVAMAAYVTAEPQQLRDRGIAVNTMSPLTYGIDFYGDTLFTTEETTRRNPAETEAFIEASIRGWKYAFQNPDEMIDYIYELPGVADRVSREQIRNEATEMRKLVDPDLVEIGHSNPGRWEHIMGVLQRLNVLPRDFSLDGFLFQRRAVEAAIWRGRLLKIFAILVIGAALGAFWIFQLRRQVALQTRALQLEMERKEEQRDLAERASRIKSLFLANMSHEIRTPLNSILGFVELLKYPRVDENQRRQYLAIIERTGKSLATVLNDILDISKVEAGKLEIDERPCSILQMLSDLDAMFRVRCESKGISLEFSSDGSIPERVVTDATRLKQVLLNVVGNAVKFTSRGGIVVEYGLRGSSLEFRVTDTGIGIAPENVGQLFRPFEQLDHSVMKAHGGTGLGLVLSQRLARLLGGDIELESSAPGKGSAFVVRVAYRPEIREAAEAPARAPEPAVRADGFLAGKRVLVVDDSEDNQLLMRLHLSRAGAVVDLAHNGLEGMDKAMHGGYHLVLMDMQMPILDGYSATRRLRERGYAGNIVALTAYAMKEDLERCIQAGCNAYLSKPVMRDDLIRMVGRYA